MNIVSGLRFQPLAERGFHSLQSAKIKLALCLLLLIAGIPVSAQDKADGGSGADFKLGYKFEQPRFYVSAIEIDLDARGEGELRFKRGESDELIDLKLAILPATMARIRQLYEKTNFLNSEENYQDKRDHSNLGWVSLYLKSGERERQARFNYTQNLDLKEVADIFRALATQRIHLLDIENSQQYQPLDTPKRLEEIENDLRLERIAEPAQLLPALRDIAKSDFAPLIARNQAKRIIESIEKNKYKTPVKLEKQ
jgi:hypothetical protein